MTRLWSGCLAAGRLLLVCQASGGLLLLVCLLGCGRMRTDCCLWVRTADEMQKTNEDD